MAISPLITIITPSFNQGQYLEETILSVLNQSYKNIEYIVIDGGSTDNSVEIIKKYENKISYWLSEKDNGQADAINKGFSIAKGDFVCWVNSDDILYPDFIERRVKEFAQYPEFDLIYGDIHQGWEIENKRIRKGAKIDLTKTLKNTYITIPQQSAIWKKELLLKAGPLNTEFHYILDYDLFFRFIKFGKIKYFKGATGFFRQHKEAKSVNSIDKWVNEYIEYYNVLWSENKTNPLFQKYKTEAFISLYLMISKMYKEANIIKLEKEYFKKAQGLNSFLLQKKIYGNKIKHKINKVVQLISDKND